jgi:hypothetical protein
MDNKAPLTGKSPDDQKAKIWMIMCLSAPSVITLLFLWIFRDAFLTILALLAVYYAAPIAYNKMAGDFDYKVKLAPDILAFSPPKEKAVEGSSIFKFQI